MTKIKLEYLNQISGGDMDFISEMLKTYIEETEKELVFLKEAFKQKNRERVYFWAHKLKTSFHMLGMEELTAKTAQLELKSKSEEDNMDVTDESFLFIVENAENSIIQAQKLIEDL